MSPNNHQENGHDPHENEDEHVAVQERFRVLRNIWQNNKGALLILISELFGASMDAMARYLQQGGVHYHTLQVRQGLFHSSVLRIF